MENSQHLGDKYVEQTGPKGWSDSSTLAWSEWFLKTGIPKDCILKLYRTAHVYKHDAAVSVRSVQHSGLRESARWDQL